MPVHYQGYRQVTRVRVLYWGISGNAVARERTLSHNKITKVTISIKVGMWGTGELDAGGTGGLLGSQFGVCIPPFEIPAKVAGNFHAAGAWSIQSVKFSRFQLHIRKANFGANK